jgi:hypothetical protein
LTMEYFCTAYVPPLDKEKVRRDHPPLIDPKHGTFGPLEVACPPNGRPHWTS